MTRLLPVIVALLFSLAFGTGEALPTRAAAQATDLSQLAHAAETVYTTLQQNEKHFLPVVAWTFELTPADFVSVSLFAPAQPAFTTDVNNRGPPATLCT